MTLADIQVERYPRPAVEEGGPEWPGPCSHLPWWWPIGDWDHAGRPADLSVEASERIVWAWAAWGAHSRAMDPLDEVFVKLERIDMGLETVLGGPRKSASEHRADLRRRLRSRMKQATKRQREDPWRVSRERSKLHRASRIGKIPGQDAARWSREARRWNDKPTRTVVSVLAWHWNAPLDRQRLREAAGALTHRRWSDDEVTWALRQLVKQGWLTGDPFGAIAPSYPGMSVAA